jgi:hypothetical protein
MRKVDLSELLEEVTNLGSSCLGPAEYQVLQDASLLLQGGTQKDPDAKFSYLTRSAQVQDNLINLLSRVSYISAMKTHEKDSYWGGIIMDKEYEGRDRRFVAINADPVYRDLSETVDVLEVAKNMVNQLLWSCKIVMQKM